MMGGMEDELKEKIAEMEEVNTAGRKLVNVKEFQNRKTKMQEQTYMWHMTYLSYFVAII